VFLRSIKARRYLCNCARNKLHYSSAMTMAHKCIKVRSEGQRMAALSEASAIKTPKFPAHIGSNSFRENLRILVLSAKEFFHGIRFIRLRRFSERRIKIVEASKLSPGRSVVLLKIDNRELLITAGSNQPEVFIGWLDATNSAGESI
jgi:hypothetical protein